MTNEINYAIKLTYDRFILLKNLPQCQNKKKRSARFKHTRNCSTNIKQKPIPQFSNLVKVTPPVLTIKNKITTNIKISTKPSENVSNTMNRKLSIYCSTQ